MLKLRGACVTLAVGIVVFSLRRRKLKGSIFRAAAVRWLGAAHAGCWCYRRYHCRGHSDPNCIWLACERWPPHAKFAVTSRRLIAG